MAINNYKQMIKDYLAPYNASIKSVAGKGLNFKTVYIIGTNGYVFTVGGKNLKACYEYLIKGSILYLYKKGSYS